MTARAARPAPGPAAPSPPGVAPGTSATPNAPRLTSDPGLGRSSRVMALGTVASRATGFVRNAVIVAVLGLQATSQTFNVANTAPNIVYELLLGGILTSVVVPLLVEASRRDDDGGTAYAQKLLTLVTVTLTVASALAVLAAPLLMSLYLGDVGAAERSLAVTWARYFLPQIAFYGVSATIGAVLNSRGSFAAPMWAPVLNNVVVILTGGAFLLVPGPSGPSPTTISGAQVAVLGVGTTAGIVVMTVALLPALRASGFAWRWRFDPRGVGVTTIARLGAWTLLYVLVSQAGLVVVIRLAKAVVGYPTYVYAFTLWQLPHAIVAVSVITALLPRMSRSAVDGRLADLRRDLDRGIVLVAVVLVPAALALIVLGRDIAVLVYAHGVTTVAQAREVGVTLAVFAVGLLPFSVYQLQSRAYYALRDTRTPALIQCAVVATLVVVDVLVAVLLPASVRVPALAAGHATSYLVGLAVSVRLLRRRVGADPAGQVVRTLVRLSVAGILAALLTGLVAAGLREAVGPGPLPALLVLVVAGAVGGTAYVGLAVRMRVREVHGLVTLLRTRLAR